MSLSRPTYDTPRAIIEWFCKVKDPKTINEYLAECRKNNFAEKMPYSNEPLHIIVHALTTNDINSVCSKKLNKALEELPNIIPVDDVLKMMIVALQLIVKILQCMLPCNTHESRECAKLDFVSMLKKLNNNPFVNLPHMELNAADLSKADLCRANFEGAKFSSVNFNGVDFQFANLRKAKFHHCDLRGSNLSNANLCWADLSTAMMDGYPEPVSLKCFLETNHVQTTMLAAIPTVTELTQTLSQIESEVENEATHKGESLSNPIFYHHYHNRVADGLVRLAKQINNPQVGLDLMLASIDHHFFAGNIGARFMAKVNKVVGFFHHHTAKTPDLGSLSQAKLIAEAARFEQQIQLDPASKPSV